ncbi:hypothetical protein [Nitratireductor sp. XY-223]|uniref:hypothetical protein n=1 Tax=Nitratireductor sp. XY-223 TaxID=2561926 RepID=UPI0010AAD414|nr:hypothetical protein [Nitratireductor sp. XY-223]
MVAEGDVAASAPAKAKTQDTCFVMMPFGGYYDMRFEDIYKPAVEAANLTPLRADDIFMSSQIMSDIWSGIQKSGPLLADLTEQNPNVFYELGLAHALGKPVVLVANNIKDVPFDLRPYRVFTFDNNKPGWDVKLREDITACLKETAANPIDAVPDMFREIVPSQAPEQGELAAKIDHIETTLRTLQSSVATMESAFVRPVSSFRYIDTSPVLTGLPGLFDEPGDNDADFSKAPLSSLRGSTSEKDT